ncbi:MAG: ABC transporter ATP-binding protein [Clostridia bacterium]|nr:ABC transporter ATP-binding protein [Clostridia bacterium]
MLKKIIKDYKKQVMKVTLGRIATSVMVVCFYGFMIVMIEYAIPSQNIKQIIQLGILYFGINILRTMATLYEAIHHDSLEKEIEADYRQKIFFKLQELKQSEIDTIKVGEILENIINDTKLFSKYYTYGVARSYFGGILRLIGILAVLLYLNVPIVMITFFIYIVGFIVTYFFNKKSIGYTKLKKDANAKILNWSNEQIEGYQTIKALEIEEQRLRQIKQLINDYEKSVNKLEKNIRTYTGIYEFLVSLVGIVNILIGSISLEQGILSYGSLVILVRYIDQPEVYARWFIEGFQMRNMSKISYSRIEKILQKEEESIDRGKELSKVEKIECKNISFTYSNNQKVLENISFVAKKNEKIALIGRTGSGKTTLVNLISRFYDLQKGEIKINGEDYQKYSIRSLRDKIGYIMQKVVIFNGTILENINYVNKNIAKDQIIEICKKLALHEKIMSFENGYETIIKPDTDLFSTGEKQLLNFSRVMVENPEIIILDEATASLSYQSEMLIRKAIEEITKEKISFIIAHRLSTIKNCDKILLMKNGKILEEGKHDELMKKQGEYYNLLQ